MNEEKTAVTSPENMATHRHFAIGLNNLVWERLGQAEKTEVQTREVVESAHASYYHWSIAGTIVHAARAAWLVARVYAVANRSEPALYYARCTFELCQTNSNSVSDFDLVYANEAMARALAATGSTDEAQTYYRQAVAGGAKIADQEDRAIFQADFASPPWYGLKD